MLADAPNADTAFKMLYDFIEANSDGEAPSYYVYGNSDVDFINSTLRHMSDTQACICAQAIDEIFKSNYQYRLHRRYR